MGTAIIIYLAVILLIAYIFSRKQTLADYFTNAGHTSLPMMVASNCSTLVGAGVLATMAEVYRTGISFGILELAWALLGGIFLAFIAPKLKQVIDQTKTFTIPDYMGALYGSHMRQGMMAAQVILLVIWSSVQAIAIAKLISYLLGLPYELGLLISAGVIITYCTMGGIKLDIITDFIQFCVMVAGFIAALIFILPNVGSFENVMANIPQGHWDPFSYGSAAMIIVGGLLTSILSLGNSAHWQRLASAKDLSIVRPSFIWSIPFAVFFVLTCIVLGLAALTLAPNVADADHLFFIITQQNMPGWAAGIVVASTAALIMSSLDSLLIALSAIISQQLKDRFELTLKHSRLITLAVGALCFTISYLFPTIVGMAVFAYNIGIATLPAILGAIYRRPKYNVGYSLWLGLGPTIIIYPFLGKTTFLIGVTLALIALFWPMKNKTPAAA